VPGPPPIDVPVDAPLDVRVVYSDLDGTMLGRGGAFLRDPDGRPTGEPASALLEALARGIEVVPATGRTLAGLLSDARILGLSTVIGEMGAVTAYDLGREIVTALGVYPGGDEPPAAHMERVGAVRVLLDAFPGRLEHHTPWSARREYTQLLRGLVDPVEADGALAAAGHGWLTLQDNGRLRGSYLGLPPGTARVYHLVPRGVDKGVAVARDLARRGLGPEHAIAVGDAIADLAMARAVGALVLVGDAVEGDAVLSAGASRLPNVRRTARPGNLGWADAVWTLALDGRRR
jgi:hypothetical protein